MEDYVYKIEVHFKNTNKTVKIDKVLTLDFSNQDIVVVVRKDAPDSIVNKSEYTCITEI